jgi:hypothetical protein
MGAFGIFSDEGIVEDGFSTLASAEAAIRERYSPEDELHAGEICHDHPEHEGATCEGCAL